MEKLEPGENNNMQQYRYGSEYVCGFDALPKEAKDTYEFEASLCEKVIRTINQKESLFPSCPQCGFQCFNVDHYAVNFMFPFTSGWRVVWSEKDVGDVVYCSRCGFNL